MRAKFISRSGARRKIVTKWSASCMADEAMHTKSAPKLRVSHLNHAYRRHSATAGAHAPGLIDVSFEVEAGQTLSIIGESGSGKSTIVKCILGLEKPASGEIQIDGVDILGVSTKERRALHRKMQAVFQDSASSLNPRLSVEEVIVEPLVIHRVGDSRTRNTRAKELFDVVGLPQTMLRRRPSELSGGQRQRIAIARALSIRPELLILDEPLTAMDLSIKAQLSNLLLDLQKEFHLTYLHISHDLFGVANLSDSVAVLRNGRIVECAGRQELFTNPKHADTRSLLAAIS
jgi:peptide/nickel transport system ATP-binding protein